MAKKSAKKPTKNQEFILTIEDNEEGVPNLDEDELKNEESKKKSSKKKTKEDARSEDIDPDFSFALDGLEQSNEFDGWNFNATESDVTNEQSKSIDLDEIIRRKGGFDTESLSADKSDKDESDSEDELALDGFGMGALDAIPEPESEEEKDEDKDEAEDEDADEDEDEDESDDSSEDEGPKDTEAEIAQFYDMDETSQIKQTVHKTFESLNLSRPVQRGLSALKYTAPTPIQSSVVPIALMGKDIVAGAVTGSGKTAAYLIPILERLLYRPKKILSTRVIVLAPTRELAIQVCDVGKKLSAFMGDIRFGLAVGGLNLRVQEQELKTRPDIVIATPGRFIDHVRNSPSFDVDSVEILVVDEADRMLEEGFQKELTEILSMIPTKRQTMLFSATMNNSIKDLIQLSLHKPVRIMIDPPKQAATGLIQEFIRVRKRANMKPAMLISLLRTLDKQQRVIVFVATKDNAHKLRIILGLVGGLKVGELHGALSQEQRLTNITGFKNLTIPVLICTDLASRGLDIPKIEVVINYDMPNNFDVYLHRVGRTARAGRQGRSISLVGDAANERSSVKQAIKNSTKKQKVVSRTLNWPEVEAIHAKVEAREETVKEILSEERAEKQLANAERDLKKGENLLRYKDEIDARPKRTWYETDKEKKDNAKKQRILKAGGRTEKSEDAPRPFKKTSKERGLGRKNQSSKFNKAKKSRK